MKPEVNGSRTIWPRAGVGFDLEATFPPARGEVRQDLSPQELALTVIGTVFARSLFAAFDGAGGEPPQEPQARWTSLQRLLGAPPPSEPLSDEGAKP